jgi:hypothetical protein
MYHFELFVFEHAWMDQVAVEQRTVPLERVPYWCRRGLLLTPPKASPDESQINVRSVARPMVRQASENRCRDAGDDPQAMRLTAGRQRPPSPYPKDGHVTHVTGSEVLDHPQLRELVD